VIDLSLLEPWYPCSVPKPPSSADGAIKQRAGNAISISSPRNIYRCSDGKYVALSGSTQAMARRVFEVIGRSEMNEDPRFRTNTDRLRNRALVDEIVGAWFAGKTQAEAPCPYARGRRDRRPRL
jgi:crotonobetainyl-CoA:carnitine CoA-transferase CaiB-like acyl-CoA transferase